MARRLLGVVAVAVMRGLELRGHAWHGNTSGAKNRMGSFTASALLELSGVVSVLLRCMLVQTRARSSAAYEGSQGHGIGCSCRC